MVLIIFESIMLASSCSVDAFAASFAYGAKGIKIPPLSNHIINFICSTFLAVSLLIGGAVRRVLPYWLTAGAAFSILFVIGLTKILDSVSRSIISRHYKRKEGALSKELRFKMFNFVFILNLYANPEEADIDENNIISSSEAALLAVSLSLDGIATGFGAGLGNINVLAALLTSFIVNMLAIFSGGLLGVRLSDKLPFNITWLSGVILIGLAVSKLL